MNDTQIIEQKSDITPNTGGLTEHEADLMARTDLPEVKPEFAGDSPAEPEAQEMDDPMLEPTPAPKAELLLKDPSELHKSLASFIEEKTGFQITERDVKVVQLVLALHGEHQQSPQWKERREIIAAQRKAATTKIEKAKEARTEAKVAKTIDKIGEALNAGIEMLKAGASLPPDVMAGLREAARVRGVVLPGDEPKVEEAKAEDRPKAATTRKPAAKKAPAKANA